MTSKIKRQKMEILQRVICDYFHVTWDVIRSGRKPEEISIARRTYCYFAYMWIECNYSEIAVSINRHQHGGVEWHINQFQNQLHMKYEPVLNAYQAIKNSDDFKLIISK